MGKVLPLTTFFISEQAAILLQSKKITVVGTVHGISKGPPKEITGSSKERFSSKSFAMLIKTACW